jgi:uncharacterized protein (TIGR02246 family)
MNNPDAVEADRAAIMRTTADLLAAVNASDADGCLAVWADDGVLMPPNHPAVQGREAIAEYFRGLFSRSRFRFTFTGSNIQLAGDTALERVTYEVTVWSGNGSPVEDHGKGLHVYGRQPDGSWRLTQDIWSSDQKAG